MTYKFTWFFFKKHTVTRYDEIMSMLFNRNRIIFVKRNLMFYENNNDITQLNKSKMSVARCKLLCQSQLNVKLNEYFALKNNI